MASQNKQYAKELKKHLRKSYKMMFEQATRDTFVESVKQTWNDSSRAASNWQVLGAGDSPAPFIDTREQTPVGQRGEKRTETGKHDRIELVAIGTLLKYTKKIHSDVWDKKSLNFWFYNAVDNYKSDGADFYFMRARIEQVESDAKVAKSFNDAMNTAFEKWSNMQPNDRG